MTLLLSGTDGLSDVDGSAATPAIRGTDANTGIFFPAADTIAFAEGGVESARFDSSGNLGIGNSSPSQRLDVTGNIKFGNTTAAPTFYLNNTSSGSWKSELLFQNSGSSKWAMGVDINANGNNNFYWYDTVANAERMRIDASGNLLIGSTSSPASTYGTAKLNVSGGTTLIVAGYGDGVGFGSVWRQSASASGNNGWPIYFVNSSETAVGGVRQRASAVEYMTTSSGSTGAILLNSGVQFPATQVASTEPNTLDDYEEGTWTPTYSLGSGSGTFTTQVATYTKIGRVVTLALRFVSSGTSSAANLAIGGLPFSLASSNADSSGIFREYTTLGQFYGLSFGSATTMSMHRYDNNNGLPNGTPAFSGSITYTAS